MTVGTTAAGKAPSLPANAIGSREVLCQPIAGMAPGAAVAASIPTGPGVAGLMGPGIIYLGYRYPRHPRTVAEAGLVHLGQPASGPAVERTVTEG